MSLTARPARQRVNWSIGTCLKTMSCSSTSDFGRADWATKKTRSPARTSLNVPMGEDGDSQWQDLLGDEGPLQDERVAEAEERDVRHALLNEALETLNERERHMGCMDTWTCRRGCEQIPP